MKTIAYATDGSQSAADALAFAVELCKETGATLEVIAVTPPRAVGKGSAGIAVTEVEEVGGAEHLAESAAATAREAGLSANTHVRHGDPAKEIADAAAESGADLLVVGSRGLGALRGALMGSVSRSLVAHSKVPVTVVKSDGEHGAPTG